MALVTRKEKRILFSYLQLFGHATKYSVPMSKLARSLKVRNQTRKHFTFDEDGDILIKIQRTQIWKYISKMAHGMALLPETGVAGSVPSK